MRHADAALPDSALGEDCKHDHAGKEIGLRGNVAAIEVIREHLARYDDPRPVLRERLAGADR